VIAPEVGVDTISYPWAMLVTLTLWLAIAPLAAVSGRRHIG